MRNLNSCHWVTEDEVYRKYHDLEWGRPVYEDQKLFEMLCLEGAQAGLSWITVLKKREAYRKAFYNFEVKKGAKMADGYLEKCLQNPRLIRNRLKIYSVRTNAQSFLKIQKEFGSFSNYLWAFVGHKPIKNYWKTPSDIPAKTELSDKISKDLKSRGFKFVGPTIIYAYLQAVGVVDDHEEGCFLN